jgi:hypothetical protein
MDLTTKAPELADVGEGVPSITIYKSVKKVKEREQPTRENAPNLLAAAKTSLGQRFQCRQKTKCNMPTRYETLQIRKQIQETSTPLPHYATSTSCLVQVIQ